MDAGSLEGMAVAAPSQSGCLSAALLTLGPDRFL